MDDINSSALERPKQLTQNTRLSSHAGTMAPAVMAVRFAYNSIAVVHLSQPDSDLQQQPWDIDCMLSIFGQRSRQKQGAALAKMLEPVDGFLEGGARVVSTLDQFDAQVSD
jgi:hypothetical protein